LFGSIDEYTCDCGYLGFKIDEIYPLNSEEKPLKPIYGNESQPNDRIFNHGGKYCKICNKRITPIHKRLQRFGHIELAAPIVHLWSLKTPPSILKAIFDLPVKTIEKIIYFDVYIVTDPKHSNFKKLQILSHDQYYKALETHGDGGFKAFIGAEAMKELLKDCCLNELIDKLNKKNQINPQTKIINRIKVIKGYLQANQNTDSIILETLPVLPPDLRPLLVIEKGLYASADLNDLYRRVINRNNRAKRLIELNAPEQLIQNEKRMLQEAVDVLFDNGRHGRVVSGQDKRPLSSLADNLLHLTDDDYQLNYKYLGSLENIRINKPYTSPLKNIKVGLTMAYRAKGKGKIRNDLFFSILQKLRALCLEVELIDHETYKLIDT